MKPSPNSIPSIDSLQREKTIKDESKTQIFNIVLNKCIEKIVYTNRHTDKTFVIFEVPKILIGYPLYDMKSCILFLINKLSESQYIVEFIEPFYLYIDWGTRSGISGSSGSGVNRIGSGVGSGSNSTFRGPINQSQFQQIRKKYPNSQIELVYEDRNTKKITKKKKR